MTYIRLGTPYGDLICVCVTIHLRFFVLCNLRLCTDVMNASLVITLECPALGRVVDKWSRITRSSGYPSLSQPRDRQVGESTAGMPSIGLSNTLNCSVPGRGISGLLRGWLFPFLPFRWLVLPFSFFICQLICRPHPVTTLVTISSRFRYRFILSGGAIGKGKSLALQSQAHSAFHRSS